MTAVCVPETFDQSGTEKKTRDSGLLGLIEPLVIDGLSQVAFDDTVNVKEAGPPAPTSTKRLPNGTKESSETEGGGQL